MTPDFSTKSHDISYSFQANTSDCLQNQSLNGSSMTIYQVLEPKSLVFSFDHREKDLYAVPVGP